jgi:DNA-binding SARP family transcriptional activator/ABC-type transport system substrate-binding protein/streptogramin lyase
VEFLVLGPVEVRIDGRAVALGGPKQRALLALLLLSGNEVVSRDRLIDGLWGLRAATSAQRSLDSYVSRLRTLLGSDRIQRRRPGYLLRVEPDELDLERFEGLLERGRAAAAAGDASTARDLLREGLGLWRGRALTDLESEPFVAVEAERLEERRLLALEARIDAELELGGGSELVGELERLVADHPFRERLLGQLMLCLYRAGRQADALAAYQVCRRRFAEELGLQPSQELRALERRILEQDLALAAAIPSPSPARRRRIRPARIVVAALALAALLASAIVGVELGTGGSSASTVGGSSAGVFELGAGSSIVARSSLGDAPAAMAADGSSVWLVEPNAGAVERVDRASGRVVEKIALGGSPSTIAFGGGAAWAASVPGASVKRIDPATYAVTTIPLGGARASALAFGLGHLWVADETDGTLLEFDIDGRLQRTLRLDLQPTAVVVGAQGIWIADYNEGLVAQVDPHTGATIASIRVGNGPVAVSIGDGAVWVANRLDSTVSKVNPESDVATAIPVGSDPVALAVDAGSVLVGNESSATVSRIDAGSGRLSGATAVGGGPTALVVAGGRVWVGTRPLVAHRGGTLVLLHTQPLSLDPALQSDLPPFQSNGLTYDALLTNVRTGGPQALQLVPDLAVSVPVATNGGTTYTFRLRPNIRYSNGQLVRAEDIRRAIERIFRLGSTYSSNYLGIVGATRCNKDRCDLSSGIVTDDAARTITFRLRAPDPGFRANLAAIATAPVPRGTPFDDSSTIAGTGPYMIAYANNQEIRYVRNPRFHEWSHTAQPDGNPDAILMRFGLTPTQEVRAVERGKADWTADGVPAALLREVRTRFSAQAHDLLTIQTDFLQLNTRTAPFNDIRVREALNLAINRAAIARMYGGSDAATPTCQVLPPGVLGYRRYCPYTRRLESDGRSHAANLERAIRLVAASGTRGERVSVWGNSDGGLIGTTVAHYTARVLRQLGYRANTLIFPASYYYGSDRSFFAQIQVWPAAWLAPAPYEFFGQWFFCSAAQDHGFFCDPRVDREIAHAHALEVTDIRAAGRLWAELDRELVDRAGWVPLVNPHTIDFVSTRLHDYQADPVLGLIADQVSLP